MVMKMRLEIENRSQRHDINRPRSRPWPTKIHGRICQFEIQNYETSSSKELDKVRTEICIMCWLDLCIQPFFFLKDKIKSLSGQC